MFFLFHLVASSDSEMYTFPRQIGRYVYQSHYPGSYTFYPPHGSKFLLVVSSKENVSSIKAYSYANKMINETEGTAFLFPTGNGKIIVEHPANAEVIFSYVALPNPACQSGIIVDTGNSINYVFNTKLQNQDSCFFYAPQGVYAEYIIPSVSETALSDTILNTYHSIVSSLPFDSYTGERTISTISKSTSPFLFRLITKFNPPNFDISVNVTSTNHEPKVVFHGSPIVLEAPWNKENHAGKLFIILGCVSPLLLIISSIFTLVKLYRKPVVAGDDLFPFDGEKDEINN